MITFLIGLVLLIVGGTVYGAICQKVFAPDDRETPAVRLNDGVDYIPMKKWKNSLIQLLNIAGTGPISAPFWDLSFPSVFRVYLEHISVNGITFGYPNGVPTGYCKAKELVYITTAGGYLPENSSLEQYLKELCIMFGIDKLTFIKAEGLDIIENNSDQILEEAISKL